MNLADAAGKVTVEHYPIEQFARSRRTRFQLGFSRMVLHCMPSFEDAVLEPTAEGLRILAANEMALAAPRAMVCEFEESQVELEPPRVRLVRYGTELREPVMRVRVRIDGAHAEGAIRDLVARQSSMDSVDWLHDPVLIQAQAPLSRLLGYPDALANLSGSTADLEMWVSHYLPRDDPPGGKAA